MLGSLPGEGRLVIAVTGLPPAAVAVLAFFQPLHRPPDPRARRIFAGLPQPHQHRPGTVEIIHPPAAEPGTALLLLPAQEGEALGQWRKIARKTEQGEEFDAAPGQIGGAGVEQGAVVGERDIIEVNSPVIDVECAPAAIGALHADRPAHRPGDRLPVLRLLQRAGAQQRHQHHGSVVDVRIQGVFELEGPPSRLKSRCLLGPVPPLAHLLPHQPIDGGIDRRMPRFHPRFENGGKAQGAVPYRRMARLTDEFPVAFGEEFVQRLNAAPVIGIGLPVAEGVQRHHRVGHGRENGPCPAAPLHPSARPLFGLIVSLSCGIGRENTVPSA